MCPTDLLNTTTITATDTDTDADADKDIAKLESAILSKKRSIYAEKAHRDSKETKLKNATKFRSYFKKKVLIDVHSKIERGSLESVQFLHPNLIRTIGCETSYSHDFYKEAAITVLKNLKKRKIIEQFQTVDNPNGDLHFVITIC
jgi:hypothetical protein